MKKILIAVMLSVFAVGSVLGVESPERLQNLSVTVHSKGGQGSGVIITRGGINYILTAAHVVDNSRKVIKFHDNVTGGTKQFSKFEVVKIVKEILKEGRSVGKTEIEADVVAYSSPEYGDDLALLKLRDNVTQDSVEFWTPDKISPPVGTKLAHVGSFLGQDGSNSFSEGRISQVGRVLFDHVFDQTDVIAFPGSSGGGIFLNDTGEYIGTLVRGAGQGYILYVPARRIKTWAEKHNVQFIFEKDGKLKGEIKLETLEPTTDSGGDDGHSLSERLNKLFPFLLWKLDVK